MAWKTIPVVLLVLLARCAISADLYPPVLTSVLVNGKPPTPLFVPSVNDINITCQSQDGTPIWWVYPDSRIRGPSGSYIIPQRDAFYQPDKYNGLYYCFTNNTLGAAYSSPINLKIGVVNAPTSVKTLTEAATQGQTLRLVCNTADIQIVQPEELNSAIEYIWYWQDNDGSRVDFGRHGFEKMYDNLQGRIARDELNRLYIRNLQMGDFNASTTDYIGCNVWRGRYVGENDLAAAKYTVRISSSSVTPTIPSTPLIYITPSVSIVEGGNFTLACIFNLVPGASSNGVTWNRSGDKLIGGGTTIQIYNASRYHNGTWECTYNNAKGTVDVLVRLVPRVSGLQDTFATIGADATFTCNYQPPANITWYKNGKPIVARADFATPSNFIQAMTLKKVDKSDIAVYSCEASNDVAAVRSSGRLIVTDPTVVNVTFTDAGKVIGTELTVDANTTSIKVACTFSADSLISNPSIVWRMSQLSQDIDENTVMPTYGLSKGSVVTQISAKQSSLTISVLPDYMSKVVGNVTCVVKYQILGANFAIPSANTAQILQRGESKAPVIVTVSEFPYWIIGVIIAALFLILLVFLIIFCVQRNKGEQYYVDEKERKAGHDPREELPPWQEFNRPDQDPVKGSRASLEMEGERPLGSDTGSMDEYAVDTNTGKFNEDGSFIGQYGPTGQRSGASGHI